MKNIFFISVIWKWRSYSDPDSGTTEVEASVETDAGIADSSGQTEVTTETTGAAEADGNNAAAGNTVAAGAGATSVTVDEPQAGFLSLFEVVVVTTEPKVE